jgi:hypothetical protein
MSVTGVATASPWAIFNAPENSQPSASTQEAGSDEDIGRQRFAALLGLSLAQMDGSLDASTRQKTAATAVPSSNAAATAVVDAAPSVSNPGKVTDKSGVVIQAGTIVDGLVSAGPLYNGIAPMTGQPVMMTGTRFLEVVADAKDLGYDPIALIKDRLAKLGVNTKGIEFQRWNDAVHSLEGTRINDYVTANIGGVKADFAVERVLTMPDVTAVEIQTMLRNGAAAS